MAQKLVEIASEIVKTQVSLTPASAAEISSSLRQIFGTLLDMQRAESGEIALQEMPLSNLETKAPEALTPEKSIQNTKIVCLECGTEMRQLTQRHLKSHGLTSREYKQKWGFNLSTPLAARSLTKSRSLAAKKRGLPDNLLKFIEQRRQKKTAAASPVTPEPAAATPADKTAGTQGNRQVVKRRRRSAA
jgi:predicted transcriptional regulator